MKKVILISVKLHIWIFIFCLLIFCFSSVFADPGTSLSLSFLGDLMAHIENFRIEDYSVVYEDIRPILISDDLTFSNLETPVDEKLPYKGYPRFNIHKEYVQAAINAGIDVFPLANNHSSSISVTSQPIHPSANKISRAWPTAV